MTVTQIQRAQSATHGLVRFRQVCREMGIHPNTGYRLRARGEFPIQVLQVASFYYCRRTDLDAYLHARAS